MNRTGTRMVRVELIDTDYKQRTSNINDTTFQNAQTMK